MIKPHLSHLFTCQFIDGTTIHQTQDDVSSIDPSKSAFYDVLQRIDEIARFTLNGPDRQYTLDLQTGRFTVGGSEFFCCDPSGPNLAGCKYRLVYFRRVTLDFDAAMSNVGRRTQYFMGWQTTDADGKNHQQTIVIEGA